MTNVLVPLILCLILFSIELAMAIFCADCTTHAYITRLYDSTLAHCVNFNCSSLFSLGSCPLVFRTSRSASRAACRCSQIAHATGIWCSVNVPQLPEFSIYSWTSSVACVCSLSVLFWFIRMFLWAPASQRATWLWHTYGARPGDKTTRAKPSRHEYTAWQSFGDEIVFALLSISDSISRGMTRGIAGMAASTLYRHRWRRRDSVGASAEALAPGSNCIRRWGILASICP